jgi:hypothetical protein
LRILFLTLSIALLYPILLVYIFYPVVLAYVSLHFYMVILTYSLVVLTTIVLYLLACDPLPPCAGKVTEWLRGWVPARAAAVPSNDKS